LIVARPRFAAVGGRHFIRAAIVRGDVSGIAFTCITFAGIARLRKARSQLVPLPRIAFGIGVAAHDRERDPA
jgi:hypothetical protein